MMIELPDTSTKKGQIEASILLCKLRNWKVEDNRELEIDRTMVRYIHFRVPGRLTIDNLYTASPSIAWEFASWIAKRKTVIRHYYDPFSENRYDKYAVGMAFDDWFRETEIYRFDLKVAKRMILDKVLELAIEAELIDAAAKVAQEEQARLDNRRKSAQKPDAGIVGSKLPMGGAVVKGKNND